MAMFDAVPVFFHVLGIEGPSNGELYRADATSLARKRGGTTTAFYNNADNYACLIIPGGG